MDRIHIPVEDVKRGDVFVPQHPSGKGGWTAILDASTGADGSVVIDVRFDDGGAQTRTWEQGYRIGVVRAEDAA